jgi:hypothetical protein
MIAAGVAVVLCALTLFAAARCCSAGAAARATARVFVPLPWFIFLSGCVYLLAGVGLARGRRWAAARAVALTVAIAAMFASFGWPVLRAGGRRCARSAR